MKPISNEAAELSQKLTKRALAKIEHDNPGVSRSYMTQLIVDADLPLVLKTAVERYGWRDVLAALRELAFMGNITELDSLISSLSGMVLETSPSLGKKP